METGKALKPSGLSAEILAETHCSKCHAYTSPHLLSKSLWGPDDTPDMHGDLLHWRNIRIHMDSMGYR